MLEEKGLTCLFCEHFKWHEGKPGYSELTPGESPHVECLKKNWEFNMYEDSSQDLRECLTWANFCGEYSLNPALLQSEAPNV